MEIRYAKDNDINKVKEIWNYCFNDEESFVEYYFKNKYKSFNTIVALENKDVVSALQLNKYRLKINDKSYETSYVVGVSTLPQARGRGYMKEMMKFSLNELYKNDEIISILMPIDYRLYRKYGYEHCYDQIEYNLNIESLRNFKMVGTFKEATNEHIKDIIDISNESLKDLNGNVLKDRDYYENLLEEIKSENGYIYINHNEGYEGYMIYFINGDSMFVREIYYKNIRSLKSMLKFIYNHNTQCKSVVINAPVDDKIRFVLDNLKTSEIKIKPFMMGRVINIKRLLEDINIDKNIEIEANINIKDDFIEANNATFNISIKDNKIKVKEVNEKADISMDINAISQLAFSYTNVKEVIYINELEYNNETCIELLETIFSKKNNYINEYV